MRVQLIRRDDDRGAVAVMVAVLCTTLIGLAAFSTDIGLAYASKRNLQKATDAGALAAAQRLAAMPGTCATIDTSNAAAYVAARADAEAIADSYLDENRDGATPVDFDIRCSTTADGLGANAALVVDYGAEGSTDRLFGSVYGSGDLTARRDSSAAVEPADSGGLRPYAICSDDLIGFDPANPTLRRINYPNAACGSPSGNWYQLNCPEVSNGNSSRDLATATRDGCRAGIEIVAGQPAAPPPGPLVNTLVAACAGNPDADCLQADPGNNFGANAVLQAWQSLLGRTIVLPVFYPGTLTGNGQNAKYPVHALVGVRVCGYHWGRNGISYGSTTAGECAGTSVPAGSNSENYLILRPSIVLTSGGLSDPSCNLGQTGGACGTDSVRRVRLVH